MGESSSSSSCLSSLRLPLRKANVPYGKPASQDQRARWTPSLLSDDHHYDNHVEGHDNDDHDIDDHDDPDDDGDDQALLSAMIIIIKMLAYVWLYVYTHTYM